MIKRIWKNYDLVDEVGSEDELEKNFLTTLILLEQNKSCVRLRSFAGMLLW